MEREFTSPTRTIYSDYVWYLCSPEIQNALAHYLKKDITVILFGEPVSYTPHYLDFEKSIAKIRDSFYDETYLALDRRVVKPYILSSVVNQLLGFLHEYRDAAFAALDIIRVARRGPANGSLHIVGIERYELLRLRRDLHNYMWKNRFSQIGQAERDKFASMFANPERSRRQSLSASLFNIFLENRRKPDPDTERKFYKEVEGYLDVSQSVLYRNVSAGEKFLAKTLDTRWDWFSRHHAAAAKYWLCLDELARTYLYERVVDLIVYDRTTADALHPMPAFPGAGEIVNALISLLANTEAAMIKEIERRRMEIEEPRWRKSMEERRDRDAAKIIYKPPAHLAMRVLTREQRELVIGACRDELSSVGHVLLVINDFVEFCSLLTEPENRIVSPTKQYFREKTTDEMVSMMRQELINLPWYVAYAKIMQEKGGEHIVLNEKINTPKPPALRHSDAESIKVAVKRRMIREGFLLSRREIDRQMFEAVQPWRRRTSDRLPRHVEDRRQDRTPPRRDRRRSDEPPPRRS
jgi:hypothetical protein